MPQDGDATMNGDDTHLTGQFESRQTTTATEEQGFDQEKAERGIRLLLEAMGEDPNREKLVETWQRRVPATLETLSEGYRDEAKPTMRSFPADSDDMVVKTRIPVYSLCEHHLLPYFGQVHVAYRPNREVVGLSKLTRYIRWCSRRLTMQEQLSQDIADGLAMELDAEVVLIELAATHLCEAMRGIETTTTTRTYARAGEPTDNEVQQFRDAIGQTED